jgi:hypothetical protein
LHIAAFELWLLDRNALPFGCASQPSFATFGVKSPMRKLLIVPIVLIFAATGCQSLRRMEVWKQQTFFAPTAAAQPVATPISSQMMAIPGPAAITPAQAYEPPTPVETLMPGPVENIGPGAVEEGPVL